MRRIVETAVLCLMAGAPALWAEDQTPQPEATTALTERVSAEAQDFMVAAAHPLAAEAGYDILEAGGSAADAAVAVQMVLNLVEPQSSGIGGGAFLLYGDAALGRLTSFDGRETAPAAAGPDYWLTPEGEPMDFFAAVPGGKSVGVPGTLALMKMVHERYGKLPWATLFEPAIAMAEEGFPVSQRLAASIAEAEGLASFPGARALFFHEDGTPLQEGETLRNPDFARTLRLIAADGIGPFYHGAIARDIVAAVKTETNPGVMTLEDLAGYRVIERDPVCMEYRSWEVCGMGPPSSGALTVGQMLGILSHWDLPAMGEGVPATHLFLEAANLAFADRGLYMADSDFVDMPEGLLDPDYLAGRAELIDPEHAMGEATAGEPPWDEAALRAPGLAAPEHGTSHFVIVDAGGDVVSATTTIEQGFGSQVVTNGFLLNNELTDFSFVAEEDGKPVANRVEPGKRPRSSMAPTVVLEEGVPVLLVGSPGGSRIIPYVAQALVGILDFGLDPQEAVDRPHVLSRNGPADIEEGPEAQAMADALAGLGHETKIRDLNSGLHAIAITPEGLIGAADKRREGEALGQ
ncbi:gamma-glutamyltransferase [Rhodobacteraceae bacterium DSL-40]|uniref:gamma-glutamyltransferase n=1 Tax=Amaricoccus sp. B4 TaxID=3368557 RepID=UPI000DADBFF7